jgi:formate dehydrogenase major subunit
MNYSHPSEIMDEIARLTPTFAGVSYAKLDRLGSIQWPCNDARPKARRPCTSTSSCAARAISRSPVSCRPTSAPARKYPLLLTTGRILSQYNVGAQTRRTAQHAPGSEDVLEIHPFDAEERGINRRRLVRHRQPRRRDGAACGASPSGCSRAWSTPPSTSRNPAPT